MVEKQKPFLGGERLLLMKIPQILSIPPLRWDVTTTASDIFIFSHNVNSNNIFKINP